MSYEASTGTAGYGNSTITAFFDDRSEADRAVERPARRIRAADPARRPRGGSSTSPRRAARARRLWGLSPISYAGRDATPREGLRRGGT